MHAKYHKRLICPKCRTPLDLEVYKKEGVWLIDGVFRCQKQAHFYPLMDGVPRVIAPELLSSVLSAESLTPFLQHYLDQIPISWVKQVKNSMASITNPKAQTANLYAFMWRRYNTVYDRRDRAEWLRLTQGRLDFNAYRDQAVIDIGCGQGRYVKPFLDAGVKEVFCMDLGRSVQLAADKFRHDERVFCVQSDIYHLPFAQKFDLVFCIGVLQHLPDPRRGFLQLTQLMGANARMLAWCYGNSTIQYFLLPLRSICRLMPLEAIWLLAGFFGGIRYLIATISKMLSVLNLKRVAERLPFRMYNEYNFHYLRVNTFDHLATPMIHFFRKEELENWMVAAKITQYELVERHPGTAAASWLIELSKEAP